MPLPRFTWKSALVYLVGVAAVLFIAWALVYKLMQISPHQSITPRTKTTMLVHSRIQPATG